jgi:hypothetical protein
MLGIGKEVAAVSADFSEERLRGLKRIIPASAVQSVLRETGRTRRCPTLPKHLVVWFVVALGLFSCDCYRQVFRWLQPGRLGKAALRSTLCEARRRLGVAPLQRLFERVVRLLATAGTPGSFYKGMRLLAVDGFVLDLPDTPENERAFGRPRGGRSCGAFPQLRVLALCEVGTHIIWKCLLKPICRGEVSMAKALLKFLPAGTLLLWDRGFLSYRTVADVRDADARLLARIKKNAKFSKRKVLPDGSYLARIYRSDRDRKLDRGGIDVRIVEYSVADPARDGTREVHRLLTTLLDAAEHPALDLVELYHQRWEIELAIDEVKTHQKERPVLRSQTPAGVVQEVYGLLLAHFVVRALMAEAAGREGLPPRRISFTGTLKVLRCRLPECPRSRPALKQWYERLLEEIADEVLPERRDRINPRVIKRKMSKWPKKRAAHRRTTQPTLDFRQTVQIKS